MSPDTSLRLGLRSGGGGGAARLRWDAEAAVKAGGKEDGEVVPEGRVGCSAGGFGRAHGRGRDSAQDAEAVSSAGEATVGAGTTRQDTR